MRRITFCVFLLAVGTLIAMPFRRASSDPEAEVSAEELEQLNDRSLDILVREITENVHSPTVFQPLPPAAPASDFELDPLRPLTYEDLAVPLDKDPVHASRFNAVVGAGNDPGASAEARIDKLEKRFASKLFVEHHAPPAGNSSAAEGLFETRAQFASSNAPAEEPSMTGPLMEASGDARSVLDPLPPADLDGGDQPGAAKRWIRQPD